VSLPIVGAATDLAVRHRCPATATPRPRRAPPVCNWSTGGTGPTPYEAAAALLDPRGRYAISDSAWSMHLLGLIEQLPESRYVR
jgi:hypothetical protein